MQSEKAHLIGTSDDLWKFALAFLLAFDHGFHDTGMIGAYVMTLRKEEVVW